MPAIEKRRWTAAEVRQLIEENPDLTPRHELVDGELLVTPSPGRFHQRIVAELHLILAPYVRRERLGELCLSPSDVGLEPESILQPDLFVVPAVNGKRLPARMPVNRLLLAVEVLSPGSARYDRVNKRRAYQRNGVPEYWIVDPNAQLFERWRPADERPEVLDREISWHPDGAGDPLVVDVIGFFDDVADD